MKSERTKGFNELFADAVDEGLSVLGENARYAIYFHIEQKYGIRREDIPRRIEAFHEALTGLLAAGAPIIENLIEKALYGSLALKSESEENSTLVDHARYVKATVTAKRV